MKTLINKDNYSVFIFDDSEVIEINQRGEALIGNLLREKITRPPGHRFTVIENAVFPDTWESGKFKYVNGDFVEPVPKSATRHQIRMRLIRLTKIVEVEDAVTASVDLEFKEYWKTKEVFLRNDVHLLTMVTTLGYNSNQADQLFRDAVEIV